MVLSVANKIFPSICESPDSSNIKFDAEIEIAVLSLWINPEFEKVPLSPVESTITPIAPSVAIMVPSLLTVNDTPLSLPFSLWILMP